MAIPTIESRLKRRFIVMSGDESLRDTLRAALPEGREMVETCALGLFCEQFGWGSAQ